MARSHARIDTYHNIKIVRTPSVVVVRGHAIMSPSLVTVANHVATRNFPLVTFLVHISLISVWIGDTPCTTVDFDTVLGVWLSLLGTLSVSALYLGWTTSPLPRWKCQACKHILFSCLNAQLWFVGITWQRGSPFTCLSYGHDLTLYAGPTLVWVTYVLGLCFSVSLLHHSTPADVEQFIELRGQDPDEQLEQVYSKRFWRTELLFRAVLLDVRDKFPLLELIVHYTVVTIVVGKASCDNLNMASFSMYLVALLSVMGARRAYMAWHRSHLLTRCEQIMTTLNESLQSTALLAALILNRGNPVYCYYNVGPDLAYVVSTPLLWVCMLWSVVSSYVWLRTSSMPYLEQVVHGFPAKRD